MAVVKTTVGLNEAGQVIITCSEPIPEDRSAIFAQLPTKTQQNVARSHQYYTLEQIIYRTRHTISYQTWAEAISAAIIFRTLNGDGATSEMSSLAGGAYLAMGDHVYKLSPVGMARETKALTVARKMAVDKAKLVGANIIEEAKINSTALVADAARARSEAEEALREARSNARAAPPRWMIESGLPIKYARSAWNVMMPLTTRLTRFDIGLDDRSFSWEAVVGHQHQVVTGVWVSIEAAGQFSHTSIYVDAMFHKLPHIDHSAACFSAGDLPARIRNSTDFSNLQASMQRCLSVVQLDSLRSAPYYWIEDFKASIPADLYACLRSTDWIAAVRALAVASLPAEQEPVEVEDEEEAIWTAQLPS